MIYRLLLSFRYVIVLIEWMNEWMNENTLKDKQKQQEGECFYSWVNERERERERERE